MASGWLKHHVLGGGPVFLRGKGIFGGISQLDVNIMEYPASGRYYQPYSVGGSTDAASEELQQLVSLPAIGKRSIVMSVSVCLFVCLSLYLSVRDHISGTTNAIFSKFLCVLPLTVARSSSYGVVICYVFPVYG